MVSVVLVLSWAHTAQHRIARGQWGKTLTRADAALPGWFARDRPPAAFARMRACWYASAAMSDTNFCAARDRRRLLRGRARIVSGTDADGQGPRALTAGRPRTRTRPAAGSTP